jgi:hypothetical protein
MEWNGKGFVMIVLGIILLVLGYVLPVPLLATLGWILVVIGVVFFILGSVGRPVAGRRVWF